MGLGLDRMERAFPFVFAQPASSGRFVPLGFSSEFFRDDNPLDSPPRGPVRLSASAAPKNLVDSERMLGLLDMAGYQLLREPEGADFVIVNTCGFLGVAREESMRTIREMLKLKETGKVRGVIVTGCLAQRDREGLLEQCPGIDQIVGVFGRELIALAAEQVGQGRADAEMMVPPPTKYALPDDKPPAFDLAPLGLSENLRGMRPTLHVLHDPQYSGQARQQADRSGDRRGPAIGRRRRS